MNKTFHNLIVTLSLILSTGALLCPQLHAQTLTISAAVVSKGSCSFNNNNATLQFGTLNPLDSVDPTADTGNNLSFTCRGNGNDDITYAITVTQSKYGTAANPAMRHQDGIFYLPYELDVTPASGSTPKNVEIPLVVTGTIRHSSLQSVPVGGYEGAFTLAINP